MTRSAAAQVRALVGGARTEWGSLAFLPFVTPAYVALLLVVGGQVRPEHWVLGLLIPAIGFAGARGAAFLRDAYPWFLVITTYDAVRYLRAAWVRADSVLGCDLRDEELRFFAVAPDVTPSDWFVAHHHPSLDLFFAVPYCVFAYLALAYAAYLYFADRPRMRYFLWSFATANFLSYALWLLVPAAPPWYLRSHGCSIDPSALPSEGAALARVDALVGIDYFHAFYSRASSVFGAIPSMHAAYPMLGLLTAWEHAPPRTRPLHLFYVAWMATAAVYLDHHWVLDILAGWLVAGVSVLATRQWIAKLGFARQGRPTRSRDASPAGEALPVAAAPRHAGLLGATRALSIALVVLAVVVLRKQLPAAARGVAQAEPVALLAIVLFFLWNHVATVAWQILLRATGTCAPAFRELVRLRIEAQAVNQLIPAAGVAGEGLRAVGAARNQDVGPAVLATALDNVAGTISGIGFALPVGLAALAFRSNASESHLGAGLLALCLALAVSLAAIAIPFRFAPRWVALLSPSSRLRRLLAPFAGRSLSVRRAFRSAVALRFAERLISVGEIYVVFHAVGAPISLAGAAVVSALLVIVSLTVFFVPGQLGAAEAAAAAASVFLGLPASVGLSAALLRRARQLFVCLLGMASLLLRRRGPDGIGSAAGVGEAP